MKGQDIITCPQCEGNRVQKNDFTALFFLLFILTVWIPIIGWIVAVIFLGAGIWSATRKGKRFVCQDCKTGFRVSNDKYIRYKGYLKQKKEV